MTQFTPFRSSPTYTAAISDCGHYILLKDHRGPHAQSPKASPATIAAARDELENASPQQFAAICRRNIWTLQNMNRMQQS